MGYSRLYRGKKEMSRNSRKKITAKKKKLHNRKGDKYMQGKKGSKTFDSPGRSGNSKFKRK